MASSIIWEDLLSENNDFFKWFWTSTNGNDLIRKLNAYAKDKGQSDRIRRVTEPPSIYGIILNNFEPLQGTDYKMVKVGFTQKSIERDSKNRMEQVEKNIKPEYKPSILFVESIGCVDTTDFHKTEKRIREKVGTPISKDIIDFLKLPYKTEWVITTQKHIDFIKDELKKSKNNVETDKKDKSSDKHEKVNKKELNRSDNSIKDCIDIFKDIKNVPDFSYGIAILISERFSIFDCICVRMNFSNRFVFAICD